MNEFLSLVPPPEARSLFLKKIEANVNFEIIKTQDALQRVLLEDVYSAHPMPAFARSTVDGYAVIARDTHGASGALPAYLSIAGEVPMGGEPDFELSPASCAIIHTGGMLPVGANAVVMIEETQQISSGEVEIYKAAASGDNVIQVGEDVAAGQKVMSAGRRIRPSEIAGLMAIGKVEVKVARKPVVAIISSGDEVVPPNQTPGPGQVRDINSYGLQALVREVGGEPLLFGVLPDEVEAFRVAAKRAIREADLVVFTAGSSVSVRDLTAQIIAELGSPGVLVHGISVKPGKPTILAVCDGKPVVGLPGNPVSALVIAGLFVKPVIDKLSGLQSKTFAPAMLASLTTNLSSQAGREDWIAVRIIEGEAGYLAEPVFGKSNLIFTLSRADGMIRIPSAANGVKKGAIVEVYAI